MTRSIRAPYGAWPSPISPEALAAATVRLGGIAIDGVDSYWLEGRPAEGGRNVLVRRNAQGCTDVTPAPFNVRTRAHEYGGGAYAVRRGQGWFCNDADQRIYSVVPGAAPEAVTAPGPYRYADLLPDAARRRLIAVREDHSQTGHEPVNELVAVDLETGRVRVLASGHDFYASPTIDPDGEQLAFISWDHPNMPWVSSSVWRTVFAGNGELGQLHEVAGGPGESVFQPAFSPDGILHLVSDRSGWWNIYRVDGGELRPLLPRQAEFGRPQWQFGMQTYGFAGDGRIVCCRCESGRWRLGQIDPRSGGLPWSGDLSDIECGLDNIDGLAIGPDRCVLLGGGPLLTTRVVSLSLSTGSREELGVSANLELDERGLSQPEALTFPTDHGEIAHAFLYQPKGYAAQDGAVQGGLEGLLEDAPGARPPLLVVGHGGPTGATSPSLDLRLQYWTSRGFAVLDVNYRGSTGYGRAYRDRLAGAWGIADVADCVAGARYLGDQSLADPARLAIRGGSAGGYTALAALCFHDVFSAGASYYGISELEALARDTHKFESRYLDWLVGPYPAERDRYVERSPIHHVDGLSCPVIFFQGLEDKVVPPNQAQMMVDALEQKGLPVAYLSFEGEQHGFRKASTIRRTLDAELYFYGRIFGFCPFGEIEPVAIKNLDPDPS